MTNDSSESFKSALDELTLKTLYQIIEKEFQTDARLQIVTLILFRLYSIGID